METMIQRTKIKRGIKNEFEAIENGNTIYKNVWDAAKPVLREKFIVTNGYIKKKSSNKQPKLTLYRSMNYGEKRKKLNSKLQKK